MSTDPRTRAGHQLRAFRRRAALSTRDLGELADVAANTIRNAELGAWPYPRNQDKIARALSRALGERIDPLEIWPLPEPAPDPLDALVDGNSGLAA